MNATSVDSFLPQSAEAPQGRSARHGSFETSQPFESFLQTAAVEQRPATQRRQPAKDAPSPEPGKPRETRQMRETRQAQQSERPDSKPPREDDTEDTAVKVVVGEAAAPVLPDNAAAPEQIVLPEVRVEQTEIAVEQPEQQVETIPVQVVDTNLPQAGGQPQDVQPEFTPEIETAEAEQPEAVELKPSPENTTADRPVEKPEIEQTISSDRQPASINVTRENAQEPKDDVDVMETREPSDVEPPPAPAAPDDSAGERQQFEADPGRQVNIEVRQAGSVRQAAAQNPETVRVSDSQVIDQVVRSASLMQNDGRSEIRVQLRPPELGTVRLQLSSDRNQNVEARIIVERDDVRDLIQRNIAQLREQLAAAGVSVGGFDVSTQHSNQSPADHTPDNNDRFAWDGAGEQRTQDQSSRPLGINRSTSNGAIDYLV